MVFSGRSDMDVQGVYLRQMIKALADSKDFKINGHVRNLKEGTVEVLCDCDEEKAKKFYRTILCKAEEKRIRIREDACIPPTDKVFDFKSFKIIMEDDLKEMVWALQGAGRIFKEQEEVAREEFLKGFMYELRSISDYLRDVLAKGIRNRRLRTFSMENVLKQPPSNLDGELVSQIGDLYHLCLEINDAPKGKVGDDLKETAKEVLKLISSIEDKLEHNSVSI